MSRGDVWVFAGGGDYTGRGRPAVILQDDRFELLDSVTLCALTTDETEPAIPRVAVEPDDVNGLDARSTIMVDKITTVRKSRLSRQIGRLSDEDLTRLDRALLVFLGFAT